MNIKLPEEVIKGLPEPSSDDGLIRVTVGLKLGSDGSVNLVEVNDNPVPTSDEEADAEPDSPEQPGEAPEPPSDEAQMSEYSKSASQQLTGL